MSEHKIKIILEVHFLFPHLILLKKFGTVVYGKTMAENHLIMNSGKQWLEKPSLAVTSLQDLETPDDQNSELRWGLQATRY